MLEYIKWRGDLTFDERELNEIDSMIFCMLSYENFDDILYSNESLTLQQVSDIFFKKYTEEELKNRKTLTSKSYEVLKAMVSSPRYHSLILSNYTNEIDDEKNLQFCALTIEYKNKWKYIVFRGTDDTLVGWKEDFMMTYRDEILSQRKAVEYINKIYNQESLLLKVIHKYDYYIGGHSKGGNLAIYASGHAHKNFQKRMKRVDNFDGPGFSSHVWKQESMLNIVNKVNTYIPTMSFFGRMFEHRGKLTVIKSKQSGFLQHDLYNWFIDVDHFVYDDEENESSHKAVESLNELLLEMNHKEKEELIEGLFEILKEHEIYTLYDLLKVDVNRSLKIIVELNGLDNQHKKRIIEILKIVFEYSIKK